MKDFLSEPRIPPMYFRPHQDPTFINTTMYLPAQLQYQPPKKSGLSIIPSQPYSTQTNKRKLNGHDVGPTRMIENPEQKRVRESQINEPSPEPSPPLMLRVKDKSNGEIDTTTTTASSVKHSDNTQFIVIAQES